jgi:hypothetical protein
MPTNSPFYTPREPLIPNSMAMTLNEMELIPTPLMTISQQSEFKENGEVKTITRQVELKGKILAVDPVQGEQEPIGATPLDIDKKKLSLLRNKIANLESVLVHDINNINITTPIVGPNLSQLPNLTEKFKLKSKNFQINEASLICDYTISLEQIVLDTQEPDETWSLDPADEYGRFVKINRTRSIQVKSIETEDPTEIDYNLAIKKLKPSTSIVDASTYLTVPTGGLYNKTTSYSVNTYKNSVECNESWVISTNPYIIEQTTTTKESSESIYKSASLQGTITGYEGEGKTKYANAEDKLKAIKKANPWEIGKTYTIGSITGKVKSISEGSNIISGVITFSVDISEGIEETGERTKSITWTDTPPLINFVSIVAIGKEQGPIIQKLTTKKNGVKTVNVEVLYNEPVDSLGKIKIPTDVDSYKPNSTDMFLEKDDVTYDYKTGKITRSVVWNYN